MGKPEAIRGRKTDGALEAGRVAGGKAERYILSATPKPASRLCFFPLADDPTLINLGRGARAVLVETIGTRTPGQDKTSWAGGGAYHVRHRVS